MSNLPQLMKDYAVKQFHDQSPDPEAEVLQKLAWRPLLWDKWITLFARGTSKDPETYLAKWSSIVSLSKERLRMPDAVVEAVLNGPETVYAEIRKGRPGGSLYKNATDDGKFWIWVFLCWCSADFMREAGILGGGAAPAAVRYNPHPSASMVAVLNPIINPYGPISDETTSTRGTVVVVNDHDAATEALTQQLAMLNTGISREASLRVLKHEYQPRPPAEWQLSWQPTMSALQAVQRAHPHMTPVIEGYVGSLQ